MGWLDIKLMVVFFVVVFLYISISKLEEFLIIRRSRKLMYPFLNFIVSPCIFHSIMDKTPTHALFYSTLY